MDAASGASKGASKGKTSAGGASSVDAGEDSESESESSSSSSSSSQPPRTRNVSEELESFRLQWKSELKKETTTSRNKNDEPSSSTGPVQETDKTLKKTDGLSVEETAKKWFLQGVGLERKGDLYDAVQCYRRAIQLVPDIEYRVSNAVATGGGGNTSEIPSSVGTPQDSDNENDTDVEEEEEEEDNDGPLLEKLLKIIEGRGWIFFQKAKEDKENKMHLNDLPVEVLSYMLRWVVSSDLDVRSLDVLSNACRGFYCLCRDEKIWEMACEKVWSDVNESTNGFSSYREMFLKRPRVRFDGCYICKVTYIRPGEHSFQDESYRPWHFVEYYRYIRFLPNGEVLFLTTSEEPGTSVGGLRDAKYPRNPATMRGHFQLYGDNIVSAIVKKPKSITSSQTPVHRGRGGARQQQQEEDVTTFHLEFEIIPVKNRTNWMLKWLHYAVYITRCPISTNKGRANQLNNNTPKVTSSTFDLNPNKFPPLCFSRVKSYNQKSEGIL